MKSGGAQSSLPKTEKFGQTIQKHPQNKVFHSQVRYSLLYTSKYTTANIFGS